MKIKQNNLETKLFLFEIEHHMIPAVKYEKSLASTFNLLRRSSLYEPNVAGSNENNIYLNFSPNVHSITYLFMIRLNPKIYL